MCLITIYIIIIIIIIIYVICVRRLRNFQFWIYLDGRDLKDCTLPKDIKKFLVDVHDFTEDLPGEDIFPMFHPYVTVRSLKEKKKLNECVKKNTKWFLMYWLHHKSSIKPSPSLFSLLIY